MDERIRWSEATGFERAYACRFRRSGPYLLRICATCGRSSAEDDGRPCPALAEEVVYYRPKPATPTE